MISVYVFWFWGCCLIFGACTSALTPDTQVTSAVETSQYLDGFKQLQTTVPTTALVEGSNNTTDEHFFSSQCFLHRNVLFTVIGTRFIATALMVSHR